ISIPLHIMEEINNLGDIRLFVEAAQLGSLSAAGRKLGLTPATASARLAKLESGLKARLFERTTRQLRLTEEGRLFLQGCRQALSALDDAQMALQAGQNVVRGKVRISTTSDFGRNLLMHWLDEFNALYPDVTFGLARFHCIVLSTASGPVNEWRFTRGDEVEVYTVPLDAARETNDGAVAREWALRGYGIVVKSMWDVGGGLRSDGLRVLLPGWRYPDAPLHALYHRNRFMAPRVRVLLDFLAERFTRTLAELEARCGYPEAPDSPDAAPKPAPEKALGERL